MIPVSGTPDDWFVQFNPANASPSSPTNGGGVATGFNTGTPVSTTGTPAPTGGGGGDQEAAFGAAWKASGGKTVADLQAFVQAHPEYGATLFGSKGDKIRFASGNEYDGVLSAGAGGLGPTFDRIGGGAGNTGSLGSLGSGYMVSPIGQFTQPTADDALNSPGLQFALSEANRMMQNGAAAQGTLLNGRRQEAIGKSNVQNALAGYGDVYNRAANTFGINFGVQTRNQDAPFNKYATLADLGQKATSAS